MRVRNITIDRALQSDLPAISNILERSELPTEGLAEHLSTTLVARDGESIVGSAALEIYGADALLRSVAVAEELRGQGWGVHLTQAALDRAAQLAVHSVYLLTETAGDFFLRFGFTPTTRSDVPPTLRESVEFTTLCPQSALVMVNQIGGTNP